MLSTPETEETYRKQQLCMKFDKIVREIATISPKLKSVPLEDISVENIGEFVQVVETLKQDLLNLYSPRLVDYGRK